jgi:hypothetical protein
MGAPGTRAAARKRGSDKARKLTSARNLIAYENRSRNESMRQRESLGPCSGRVRRERGKTSGSRDRTKLMGVLKERATRKCKPGYDGSRMKSGGNMNDGGGAKAGHCVISGTKSLRKLCENGCENGCKQFCES